MEGKHVSCRSGETAPGSPVPLPRPWVPFSVSPAPLGGACEGRRWAHLPSASRGGASAHLLGGTEPAWRTGRAGRRRMVPPKPRNKCS